MTEDTSPSLIPHSATNQPSGPGVTKDVPDAVLAAAPAYAELAKIVLDGQPLGAVLARVAQLAADLVPGIEEVSVTLIERGRARSVAFSGERAAVLDERQYEDGYGPCMDAAVSGQTIAIEDTTGDTLYPGFSRAAARAGIRHTLSMCLAIAAKDTTGALNMYGADQPLDQSSRDVAAGFASYAAVAVGNAAVYAGALDEVEQLRTAMASRASIEQAKGIIMATRRCTADEAFDLLRDTSSRANRKLRDIAQALVEDNSR
jgi:GAF domain-containing protein